ncbi:hypothetical protein AMTR_s00050p00226130 [Amborella trichopoda]|uniref:Retrotransposon gag domain-containing protein n=1 Tax=Amborella trichopoda TaxID=13333 RepID=W1PZE0_AMBTC|nr:hypothetical protein AMTR_s00050p00226130 [Amborella trichopoda]
MSKSILLKHMNLRQQKGQSVSDFNSEMTIIWDQLALMEPQWTNDAEIYYKYHDESHIVQFLMALQDDFKSIRASILYQTPLPTVDATLAELMAEEARKETLDNFVNVSDLVWWVLFIVLPSIQ